MSWEKEFDEQFSGESCWASTEVKAFIRGILKTTAIELRHIQANCPLTGGEKTREDLKELIERLEEK